ncbi:MAG TPA: CBS domain-containing protein [Puia sp.]|nr:CBS domain-containing protein [Puia sp.]
MEKPELNFKEVLVEVQKTKKPIKIYPSLATEYLGVARRGWKVIETVNKMFDEHEVICEPDFGSAWFYGQIEIKPKPKVTAGRSETSMEEFDPTPRLSLLKAANLNKVKEAGKGPGLLSVTRDTPLSEAITKMLLHDFSQLPILSGMKEVEGIISWKSIGRATSLRGPCSTVAECKDDVVTLSYDEPLFNAVKFVLEKEVVLVRQRDKTISGIVTITDIGEQFIAMAEPFLIIEQIENHIRRLLDQKFNPEELTTPVSYQEKPKEIKSLADLTFGQYVKIIEDPAKFKKLGLNIDRVLILKQLEEVRKIRNDVMHFDPDGITPQNLDLLRQTVSFLHTITGALKNRK